MRTVPERQEEAIAFFSQRFDLWQAAAADLGLKPDVLADMADCIAAAEAAMAARNEAHNQARAATETLNTSIDALRELGGEIIRLARVRAALLDDPNLLAAVQVPPVRRGSPLGPPPQPTHAIARLLTGGLVELRWRCTRRGGTGFAIERALVWPGQAPGSFVLIASAERPRWLDASLPTGLAAAHYRITAHRSGGSSEPSAPAILDLGAVLPASARARAA